MLTHGNLKSQIDNFPYFLEVAPGGGAGGLLRPWPNNPRTAALYLASCGAREVGAGVCTCLNVWRAVRSPLSLWATFPSCFRKRVIGIQMCVKGAQGMGNTSAAASTPAPPIIPYPQSSLPAPASPANRLDPPPQVYTSKFKFREDLTTHPPDHFVCVPLVLETLHSKVGVSAWRARTGAKHRFFCCRLSVGLHSHALPCPTLRLWPS